MKTLFEVPMRAMRVVVLVALAAIGGSLAVPSEADAQSVTKFRGSATGNALAPDVDPNGVLRQNAQVTLLASATRSESATAVTSSDITNYSYACARIYLNLTDEVGTCTLSSIKLQSKDPVSGTYFDIPGASLSDITATTSDDTLTVCPGIAETANETVSDHMPYTWRFSAVVGTGGAGAGSSFTFSVGADLYQ